MHWIVRFQSESVALLEAEMSRGYIIELADERRDGREYVYFEKAQVGLVGSLKIFIFANEHPPPHFHVKYNGEENSFRIDDATPIYPNGGLKRWFKNIKKWHGENKYKLIHSWNSMRPSNCPVGPVSF